MSSPAFFILVVGVALRGHPVGTAQSPSPTENDVGVALCGHPKERTVM